MVDTAIEARGLTKRFAKDVLAVDGLDLSVERGTVYGMIGRNGAGKTTTLRLLMGLLRPTAGSARILGTDPWAADSGARGRAAYVSQGQRLHDWMTPADLCRYLSHFYEAWDTPYARNLAKRFGIPWERQVGLLSGGDQRKVAVLLAFAARPAVAILDEPAGGLDPIARRALLDAIVDLLASSDGCTIFLSTHLIADLERLAETIGIMDRGRLAMSSRVDELQGRMRRVQVVFDAGTPPPGFSIPGAVRSHSAGSVVTAVARIEEESQIESLRRTPGARVEFFPMGLEEIYVELFGTEPENPGEERT